MSTARETDFSNMGFRETVKFYKGLRTLMYDEMNNIYPGFQSGPITLDLALTADTWANADHSKSRQMWSWVNAYSYYTDKKRFKRYDLSVKRGGSLVGLVYGVPSQAKTQLKVNLIEGTPISAHKKDARIFELISESAQIYADLLGADEIRIMRPVNQEVANYYCTYGFEFVEPAGKNLPVYCSLKLRG